MIAALTSSLQPSNFDRRTGLRLLLNLSWFTPGAGFISAAISQPRERNHKQCTSAIAIWQLSDVEHGGREFPRWETRPRALQVATSRLRGEFQNSAKITFRSWGFACRSLPNTLIGQLGKIQFFVSIGQLGKFFVSIDQSNAPKYL